MTLLKFIAVSVCALTSALAILFVPFPAGAIIIFAFCVVFLCRLFPKTTMCALAIFLPFQRLLALRAEESAPFLALFFKWAEEGVILIAFFVIVLARIFRERRWKGAGIELPLFFLVVIAVLGSLRSRLVPVPLSLFDLFLLLKGFLVFYIFYSLRLASCDIARICKIFFSLACFVFVFGVVDFFAPEAFRAFLHSPVMVSHRFGMTSAQSFFIHPGIFGWFMAFFTCFSLSFFIIFEKKAYLSSCVLFVLGTLLSMRFKPFGGLLAAAAAALIFTRGRKRINFVFSAGMALFAFVLLFGDKVLLLWQDKVYTYLEAPELYAVARNVLYSTGWRIALDYFPLGSGLGTFGGWVAALYYSPLYVQHGLSAVWGLEEGGKFLTDTFWPYIIGQFGFLGLACYGWILFIFLRAAFGVFRRTQEIWLKAFAFGVFLALIEGIVESAAEPVFLTPPQYFFIFGGLGMLYSAHRADRGSAAGGGKP